ncbi:hypothetical protein [Bacillus oleivorans]|nr:hypothetical protein [Bacillus oleivorans]
MNVKLEPVNKENFHSCIRLKVAEDQKNYVATNLYSIAGSKVNPNLHPYVINDGDAVIGFVMTDIDLSETDMLRERRDIFHTSTA